MRNTDVEQSAGVLSAHMIKALCAVLHADKGRRDGGLKLLEAFDSIDLAAVHDASAVDAAMKRVGRVQAIAHHLHAELDRAFPGAIES
jgi:hypothetical protein